MGADAPLPKGQLEEIARRVEALRPTLVETRRDIHRHPELSNCEVRTARMVTERLRALGVDEIKTNVAGHGVIALINGAKPGPVVAYRADMDALPINEARDVPYKSTVAGVMHACGHDAHTTIGLGVAEVLCQMRDQLGGSVKLLFEPAEEGLPLGEIGGARLMIKEGALENPKPGAIFGLHVSPEIEVGKMGCRPGPAQASLDAFDITIRGKRAFVLRPEQGSDAVAAAAQCVTAMELIRGRAVNAFEPMLLNIGRIEGGKNRFGLAEEVKMEGCLRTLNEEVRQRATDLLRQTLKSITEANNATFDLAFSDITAVLLNNPGLAGEAMSVVRQAVGQENIAEVPQRLGGEDFSYFAQVVPGCFFRLGCGNASKGITAQIHSPEFDIDEECLVIGARTMSAVLMNYLNCHA